MKVKFRVTYFGPDGNRYRPRVVHEIPDEWESKLPKSAMQVPDEVATGPVSPAPVLTRAQRRAAVAEAEKKAEEAPAVEVEKVLEEVEPKEGMAGVQPNAKTKAALHI